MWQQDGLLWLMNLLQYGGSLSGARAVLFKEELTGDPEAKNFDPDALCDFPGYADIQLSFPSAPAINVDGDAQAETQVLTWTRNVTGTAQNVVAVGVLMAINNSWRVGDAFLFYDDSFASVILAEANETFVRKILFKDRKLTVTP